MREKGDFFRFAAVTARISEVDGQLEEYNDESDKLTRQLDGLYDQQKVGERFE